ncbi:MAG: hypothetical protein JRH18_25500 [Deltaproteobacteria bacterium]|nr:hypothetical protein [Deltaproteobacteria bacterium]MBW2154999.1 hypothetical protein [Deltaproteobacteria bacterium]
MLPIKKRKCKNCHIFFFPDTRNVKRQQYCSKVECRTASKKASQRKWLNKPENRDYFCGHEHVERVRRWRGAHPGYWRKKPDLNETALQDRLICQPIENNKNTGILESTALQDLLIGQPFVLLGLIANFTGTALQDDIDITLLRLQQLGRDIANQYTTCSKGGLYGVKVSYPTTTCATGAAAVQLDRPAAGS